MRSDVIFYGGNFIIVNFLLIKYYNIITVILQFQKKEGYFNFMSKGIIGRLELKCYKIVTIILHLCYRIVKIM